MAIANGKNILISLADKEAAGCHRAVRDRFDEDIHLAGRVKALGLPIRLGIASGIGSARMYTSLDGIVRGWSRILYDALGRNPWRLLGRLLDPLVYSQSGHVALAWALILFARGEVGPVASWLLGLSLVHHAFTYAVLRRLYLMSVPGSRAIGWFPLANLVMDWVLLRAIRMCLTGRVTWRGTVYEPAAVTKPVS
jgi:hypothetical protein